MIPLRGGFEIGMNDWPGLIVFMETALNGLCREGGLA